MRINVLGFALLFTSTLALPTASVRGEPPAEPAAIRALLAKSSRIVFLGDSITAAGPYVSYFETWLRLQPDLRQAWVVDAGLPSETVSGLSEEGHAGGQFPRPDLAERLARILRVTRPDFVFACYGMNCGIYQPFQEQRFQRYQAGLENLKSVVESGGAQIVLITPPTYDDQQAPREFSYNEVLDRYSAWLLQQRSRGWNVIDLHSPMTAELRRRRQSDPSVTLQPDGVHPNSEGEWAIARQVIRGCGDDSILSFATPESFLASHSVTPDVLHWSLQRVELLRDAYVGAAGHQRPGIAPGLPIDAAVRQADALAERIKGCLPPLAPATDSQTNANAGVPNGTSDK